MTSGSVDLYGQDAVISENAWSDVGNPNMAAVSAVMLEEPAIMGNGAPLKTDWYYSTVRVYATYTYGDYFVSTTPPQYNGFSLDTGNLNTYIDFESSVNNQTLYIIDGDGFYITRNINVNIDYTKPTIETVAVSDGETGEGIDTDMKPESTSLTVTATDADSGVSKYYVYCGTEDWSTKTPVEVKSGGTATTSASVSLTSLDYNTTYHYAVVAEDVAGNLSTVSSGTFTTEKEPLTGTVTITGEYGAAEPYVFWDVLKANANITAPATPGDITYTWYRGSEEVQSGTTSTYQIGSADVGKEMWCKVTAANAKGSLESGKYAIGKAAFSGAYKVWSVEVNDTYGIDKLTFTGEESAAPYEYRMRENDAAEWSNWNTITGGTVDSGQIDCSIVVGNVNRGIGDIQIRPKENANFVPTEDSLYTNEESFTAELHESVALSGEAVYGGTLTANVTLGSFPDGNPTLLYTFKRGAEVVQAASTTNTYLVTKEDIGSQITVEVTTAEATGTLTATSTEVQKKGLTITGATVTEREYDGTTDANVESVTLSGMVTPDTLTMGTDFTLVSATYDSENAGTNNKSVEIKIALQGSAADYYTLSSDTYTLTNQTIRKKSVTMENARLEVLNGLAKTYEYDLKQLLPTGVDYEEGSIALGTIDLPSDYYNGGVYLNSEYGTLSVPILNAASKSGEIGTILVGFESSNYKAIANSVITVVAIQEKITGVDAPGNITLTDHKTSADAVIQGTGILPDSVTVFTERTYPSGTQMPITWSCDNYNTAPLEENTFTWTVDSNAYATFATNGFAMTGSITVKNPAALAVAHGNTTDEITYNGATYEVRDLFALDSNAGTATYSITGGTGAGTLGADGYTLTITKAGTFEIKVDTAATGIYAAGSATATLTVNRGNGEAIVTMADFTYGGTASEPVTSSTTNTGMTATISYKEAGAADSTYTTTKPVNAGNYVVKAEYATTDLYNAVSVTDTFIIEKAEITDVSSTLTGVIAPVAGEVPQDVLSVATGAGYSANISWNVNSTRYEYDTEYTATIVLTADANHKFADTVAIGSFTKVSGSESTFTVSRSYETLKEKLTGVGTLADLALTVHHADAAAVIAANVLPATVKVQTETNTTGIDMAVEWSFTGSYDTAPKAENTFVWTVKASEYAAYDVNGQVLNGTITVTNAGAVAVSHGGAADEITYDGSTYDVSDLFTLDTNAGAATYSIVGGTGTGTLNGSVLTITKAGTFEIKAETVATGIYASGSVTGELTVNKGVGVANVNMADFTYGETASEPVANTTTNIGRNAVITYKVFGAEDSTYSVERPIDAGNYVVKAEYAATDLYNAASVIDTFIIEKAEITDVTSTLAGVIAPVAGEAPQNTLSVTAGAGYSAAISWAPAVTAYDYDTEYTATVVLTADANHKFGDTVAMGSFTKVSGSESALTVSKSYETMKEKIIAVEDLQNQPITVHYADAAEFLAANVLPATVKVQTETNTAGIAMEVEWSFTGSYDTAPKAENTFTWTVKTSEYAAYDVNGHSMNGTIVVTNAPAVAVNNQGKAATITYTGSTYDVNNTDLFEMDTNAGTASYSIVGGTGTGTLSGSVLTITKAGTFIVKAETLATGIYAAGSAQATLTVEKGTGAATVTMADFTYGETASVATTSSTTNTGVTAVISYKAAGAEDSTYTTTKPVNAGSYVVRAEYAATDLYNAVTVTDTFVIEKATITDVSAVLSGVTAPVAGEAPQNTLSVTAGAGYSAAISWAPVVTAYEYDTEYTATVVLSADANHKFADTMIMGSFTKVSGGESILTVSKSYETLKEKLTGVGTLANQALTVHYADAAAVITANVLPATVKVQTETNAAGIDMAVVWSITDSYDAAPEAENSFTWTVKATEYAAYDVNGQILTGTITVTNAEALTVNNTGADDSITYNGGTYDVSDMFALDTNAGTATYSIVGGTGTGTLSGSVLTVTKAGTFEIKADTAATGIYAAGSAQATLTVEKGTGAATITMADFTYGETASVATTSSTTNTGVTATISYKAEGAADSTYTTTMPVNAGSYVVRAEYAVTDLYNAVTVTDTFVIEKATITDVSAVLSGVTAPVAGEAPQNTLSVTAGAGYSAAISWAPSVTAYEYDTEYTATIVFTADANHKFADTVTMGSFTKVSGTESVLTVSKSYETLKEKLTGVGTLADQALTVHYADAAAVITANVLPATVKVQTETNTTGIDMAVEWSITDSYDTAPKAGNSFTWTVKASEYAAYDVNGQTLTGTITITNAEALAVTNTGADDSITYNGGTYDVSDMFTLDANAGTATYSIVGGTGTGTLSGSVLTITKAGTFEIKAETEAIGIYASGSAEAVLTVEKAALIVVTKPIVDSISKGTQWSSIILAGGKVVSAETGEEVTGVWGWKESSAGPADSDEYTACYVPNDTANYLSVEAEIQVVVQEQKNERKPFIKGHPEKSGWDVINAEMNYIKEGGTIVVDMNGTTVVPGYIQEQIRAKKITLTIEMFPGVSWTINGNTVEPGTRSTVDMGIKVGTMEKPLNNIPADILYNLAGGRKYTTVSLAHNGNFGFEAIMNIGLNAENVGMYANLFYFNEEYNVMQFIWADDLDQYGTAHLVLTHASEYAIVLDKVIMPNSITSPKTGEENRELPIGLMVCALLSISAGSVFIRRKKKEA